MHEIAAGFATGLNQNFCAEGRLRTFSDRLRSDSSGVAKEREWWSGGVVEWWSGGVVRGSSSGSAALCRSGRSRRGAHTNPPCLQHFPLMSLLLQAGEGLRLIVRHRLLRRRLYWASLGCSEKIAGGELGELSGLGGGPGGVVAEFAREEVRYGGGGLDGGSGVQEKGTGASGEDIFDAAGHLVAGVPEDFGFEKL